MTAAAVQHADELSESKEPQKIGLPYAGSDKPPKPDARLQGCYFLMGMGLLAASCSIWQCMDYMRAVYPTLQPSRVLATCYNLLYLVMLCILFFGGPKLWPNKRRRMLTGYGMFVFAIGAPPLIDTLCHRLAPAASDNLHSLQGVMAAWAVGAAVAGAADAIVSSVIYGEAAMLGPAYTHAFLAGKAACGLTMAVIRCASKAALPALPGKEIHMLQLATSVFLAAGALLVALCVLLVAVVLPRLTAGMELAQAPATLTVQQTLVASQSIALGHPVPRQATLLPRSNTLTGMMPGVEGALLAPAFTATMAQADGHGSVRMVLSRMDTTVGMQGAHTSRLLSPLGTGVLPTWSNAYRASMRRRRVRSMADRAHSGSDGDSSGSARGVNLSRSGGGQDSSGGCDSASGAERSHSGSGWRSSRRSSLGLEAIPSESSMGSKDLNHSSSNGSNDRGDGGGVSAEAPSSLANGGSPFMGPSLQQQQQQQQSSHEGGQQLAPATDSSTRGVKVSKTVSFRAAAPLVIPPTPFSDAAGSHGAADQRSPRDHHPPSPSRRASGDGRHVTIDTAALSDTPAAAAAAAASPVGGEVLGDSAQSLHHLPSPPRRRGFMPYLKDSIARASPSSPSHRAGSFPGSPGEGEEEYHHSPFFVAQSTQQLAPGKASGATDLQGIDEESEVGDPSLGEALRSVWQTMGKVYPYQAAAALPPLITSAILPMIFSQDFSESVLGTWYVQIAAVTYQLGGFAGSALIPIPSSLRRPRATLLGAALAMLLFVGAFAAVLKLNGGPFAFIVLAFFMYMYSGYLISCTFCLAGKGLLADDAQMVQMVLVLSTAVTFVLGGFVSWAWLAVPKTPGPSASLLPLPSPFPSPLPSPLG